MILEWSIIIRFIITTTFKTCATTHLSDTFNGKVMSRDVPICNILAICRGVLNCENMEVLYITGCHVVIFYKLNEILKEDQIL